MGSAKSISSSFRSIGRLDFARTFLLWGFFGVTICKGFFWGGGNVPWIFFCKIATPWKKDDDPKRQLFQSPRVTVLDFGLQTKSWLFE